MNLPNTEQEAQSITLLLSPDLLEVLVGSHFVSLALLGNKLFGPEFEGLQAAIFSTAAKCVAAY